MKIKDYEGFKYFNRAFFKANISGLNKTLSFIQNESFEKQNIAHDECDSYMFEIDAETSKKTVVQSFCSGMLITVDDSVARYRRHVAESGVAGWKELGSCGPMIGNEFWVEALGAAANYVRHYREWFNTTVDAAENCGLSDGGIISFSNSELREKTFPFMGKGVGRINNNLLSLEKAGFDMQNIVLDVGSNFEDLCELLGLYDENTAYRLYCEYQNCLEARFALI